MIGIKSSKIMNLTIINNNNGIQEHAVIPFAKGQYLLKILNTTKEHRVRTGCPGNGSCGLCLVRIIEGKPSPPNQNEQLQLSEQQLASGVRLACQVICETDLSVEIINRIPQSVWRPIPEALYRRASVLPYPLRKRHFSSKEKPTRTCGVSIDLGTTSISLSIFDLTTGQLMTTRHGINPQIKSGLDILTRVNTAAESPDKGTGLQQDLITAIRNALLDISVGDGINPGQVSCLVLVGNTAMLTLLSGNNFHHLLHPEYWAKPVELQLPDTQEWAAQWGINLHCDIRVIPPLAGFIGSDLTAGILATGLLEEPGSLLIDFGTNSEIALWDGKKLWITSAAGGPAFEGSGVSCGMPAEKGAIYHLSLKDNRHSVIGDTRIAGICGSGLVDLLAELVDLDLLDSVGRFNSSTSNQFFHLSDTLSLNKKDVDLLQRAKAAIASGIQILLLQAQITPKDLKQVFIGGAFGYHLNIENAMKIGLLPLIDPEIYHFCGNSALSGCEKILLQAGTQRQLTRIKEKFSIVNLAEYQDFEAFFIENLFIKPMA
ncbi:ASKHA domain-containing protein [Desulfobacter latus]|uniref:DUF4445 domain-containing protein n=1 Tax=Desulfobacter latus TaxID=2292 RepID=A0A850SYR0_9BACT|nr:ASKHA domain-containing protein [Desulfobacter latus]NWH06359.1 DUF4445 domain-containing protein [Desulfobacter latus]